MSTKLTEGQKYLVVEMIEMLAHIAYENSKEHGFWDDYENTLKLLSNVGPLADKYELDTKLSKIALMHSELGEMTEAVRKPNADEHIPGLPSVAVEAADTIIRILDYAGAFHIPLAEALMAKMAYNEGRPYKHGKGA